MKDILVLWIIGLIICLMFIHVPMNKQMEMAIKACGSDKNVQSIQLDVLGLSFGWSCYKSVSSK